MTNRVKGRAAAKSGKRARARGRKPVIRTSGDDQAERRVFGVGDSLWAEVRGLRPATTYDLALVAAGPGPILTASVLTNREGTIEPLALWPQIGLDDPSSPEALTLEDAEERWRGTRLRLEVRLRRRLVASGRVAFAREFEDPILFACDAEGRAVNGFEAGTQDALLAVHRPHIHGRLRVFVVPRSHAWVPGDRFAPVVLGKRRKAMKDVEVEPGASSFRVRVARAHDLAPGPYDFIVRLLRYGYEDDEDFRLRPTDLVAHRWATGLVVRHEFMAFKTAVGGCANYLQIAGRSISGAPYFQYTDVFQAGEDVYGALDPAALQPGEQGKMVALYVVPHKTAAQWSADNGLQHLPVLGGNPAVQKLKTQVGCINFNKRLLWPGAAQVGEYDVVADFGNNSTDAATFAPDDAFDQPQDIVDGYFVSGFRVVPDPTVDASFPHAGTFAYDQTGEGFASVTDDYGNPWTVPLKAVVYFPADAAGATAPGQISGAHASYPLAVIVHGNSSYGDSYEGYNYLLEHLAKNGFIAASIHLEPNQFGTDRARVLFEHLDILKTKFGAKAANNIGIMGHSRGGEAVVIAARLNHQEGLGHQINAVISLAPTDWIADENFGGAWATPFLVVYGAMDGDLQGPEETGFSLYDRATDMLRSMVFVYGATHGRFNTVWGDVDILYSGDIGPMDVPKIISAEAHQKVAKGYMAAFLRQHLRGEAQWAGIFRGEWVPAAVEQADPKLRIYVQYFDTDRKVIDDFEGPHTPTSWQTSAIGDAVSDDATLPDTPVEDELADVDPHSPHETSGLLLRWDGSGDLLRFMVPSAQKNVSGYAALSFRVTQKVDSPSNAAAPQDFAVTLKDKTGKTRSLRVGKFAEVPIPQRRQYNQFTKSAMRTVRIPLHAFTIEVLGTDRVDLKKIESVALSFGTVPAGEIEVDSVEFTK